MRNRSSEANFECDYAEIIYSKEQHQTKPDGKCAKVLWRPDIGVSKPRARRANAKATSAAAAASNFTKTTALFSKFFPSFVHIQRVGQNCWCSVLRLNHSYGVHRDEWSIDKSDEPLHKIISVKSAESWFFSSSFFWKIIPPQTWHSEPWRFLVQIPGQVTLQECEPGTFWVHSDGLRWKVNAPETRWKPSNGPAAEPTGQN